MKTIYSLLLIIAFLLTGPMNCMAKFESVGFIKSVAGEVYIVSSNLSVRAVPNMKIIKGDSIITGADSSVGLIFEDDTVVSIGPKSEILIQDFMFDPVEKELSFVARMIKGTFSFITGQIAKLAPKNVKLETPDATLGVRGTKFLVKID